MQTMLLGSTLKLTQHLVLYGFPNLLKYIKDLVVFLIFCEFFNFAFNFAMQHLWPQFTYLCLSGGVHSLFWTSSSVLQFVFEKYKYFFSYLTIMMTYYILFHGTGTFYIV